MTTSVRKSVKLLLAALLVLAMLPLATLIPAAASGDVATVNGVGYDSIYAAVDAANAIPEGATIVLQANAVETINAKITITGKVTIEGADTRKKSTLLRAQDYTGSFFEVAEGAELTLGKNLVIDGNNNWTFDIVLYSAALELGLNADDDDAFVFSADNSPVGTEDMILNRGKLTVSCHIHNSLIPAGHLIGAYTNSVTVLENAEIVHCANKTNGVIYSASINGQSGQQLFINDGTNIHGNYGGRNGGLFHAQATNNSVVMNGGEIFDNYAHDCNGSVIMLYGTGSKFTMNGGSIYNNVATYGGANGRNAAIYIHNGGTFEMNGGEITKNLGMSCGGVDVRENAAAITINGGYIGGNEAVRETSTTPDFRVSSTVNQDGTLRMATVTVNGGTFDNVAEFKKYVKDTFMLEKEMISQQKTDPETDQPMVDENGDPVMETVWSGRYILGDIVFHAELNGVQYEYLQDAIDEAQAHELVTILVEPLTAPVIDKCLSLKLAQGVDVDVTAWVTSPYIVKYDSETGVYEIHDRIALIETMIGELQQAQSDGVSSAELAAKVTELNQAISDAKVAAAHENDILKAHLEKADSDLKIAMEKLISDSQTNLTAAIDVAKAEVATALQVLSDRVTALEKTVSTIKSAVETGDVASSKALADKAKELNETITALETALKTADADIKTDFEAALAAAKTELTNAIAAVQAELDRAVSSLNKALEDTKKENQDALYKANTFNAMTAVIVCISHAGVISMVIWMMMERKHRVPAKKAKKERVKKNAK